MGTQCHIRVVGGGDPHWGVTEVRRLEGLWTRFAPSELGGVGPEPCEVDPDTALLVSRAVAGFDLTGGLFNAFLVDQIEAVGYDRDFEELSDPRPRPTRPGRRPEVTVVGRWVSSTLPVDSGGLGKGLAADLVAQRLVERGAEGALVNLGGDLRCLGEPPGDTWRVGLELPVELPEPLTVKLAHGAVCTSTPMLRRWTLVTGGQAHHLLDPRTGESMRTDLASVSVIAREAWLGEVLAKAVFLMPTDEAADLLRGQHAAALLVSRDAHVQRLG